MEGGAGTVSQEQISGPRRSRLHSALRIGGIVLAVLVLSAAIVAGHCKLRNHLRYQRTGGCEAGTCMEVLYTSNASGGFYMLDFARVTCKIAVIECSEIPFPEP